MKRPIVLLFGGNFISKVLGLVREVMMAALFGTGQAIGAYRVAQTGTLIPVNFFTSDSLNSAFVPQYRNLLSESRDKAQTLFWVLAGIFGVLALLLCAALLLLSMQWAKALAPGLGPGTVHLIAYMFQIMGVGIPFYMVSALLMFLNMANGDFVPMAIRPSVQNIGLIGGAVSAVLLKNAAFLAGGFTAAYLVFSGWITYRAASKGLLARPAGVSWPQASEVVSAFWRTLRPLVGLPILLQGNIAVERAVATLVSLATVSALDYAKFMTETVIVLVSVPVALTGLVHWSELGREDLLARLGRVLTLMLLIGGGTSAFLGANASVIVKCVYGRGAFSGVSVGVTAEILFGAAWGLWAQVAGYVLIKALNARRRNREVLRVMAVALSVNALFNLTMYSHLGAMTLGLGNALYGIVLLGGTLTALGLWRDAFERGWVLVPAVGGYLLLDRGLPISANVWIELCWLMGLTMAYWTLWVALVPRLRDVVLEALVPKLRKAE